MAQIKIYGLKSTLKSKKESLSSIIHRCIIEALSFPKEKKFQRFIGLDEDEMIFPDDKSEQYIIIEIMMMEGRSVETKKALIKMLFEDIEEGVGITSDDIEIVIVESLPSNWGFRGMTGDEIKLDYDVNV